MVPGLVFFCARARHLPSQNRCAEQSCSKKHCWPPHAVMHCSWLPKKVVKSQVHSLGQIGTSGSTSDGASEVVVDGAGGDIQPAAKSQVTISARIDLPPS